MEFDVQDVIRNVAGAVQGSGAGASRVGDAVKSNRLRSNRRGLSGMRGVAAGAGAAALAPIAIKGVAKLAKSVGPDILGDAVKSPVQAVGAVTSDLGDRVSSSVNDKIKEPVQHLSGPNVTIKDAVKSMLPFGEREDSGDGDGDIPGVGKGRRMPVQQSVDVGLPIETVYNQWTQFEAWPNFMHRIARVTQEDDCTVAFVAKIWGTTKQFTATIETQRPDERIKWRVTEGLDHTGVVSFHELGPNLTRVLLSFDVQPGGMLEKAAYGMRHVKRAARGDLHRFAAFIEMAEHETGAWRGVIEDGKVVEQHDPDYDETREYTDISELLGEQDSDEGDDRRGRSQESRGSSGSASRPRSGGSRSGSSRSGRSTSGGSGSSGTGQTRGRSSSARRTSRSSSANGRSRGSRTSSNGSSARRSRGR